MSSSPPSPPLSPTSPTSPSIFNHISKHRPLLQLSIKPHRPSTMSAPPKIMISHAFGGPPKRTPSVISSPTIVPLKLSPIKTPPPLPPSIIPPTLQNLTPKPTKDTSTTTTSITSTIAFQKALSTAYSSSKPDGSDYLWCPVFKQYLPHSLIKHFQIITPSPYYSQAIGYLFGNIKDGESHFNSLANGMIMAKCIANLLISGDFAIIPISENAENDLSHPAFRTSSSAWNQLTLEEQTSLLDLQELKQSIKPASPTPNPGIKLKLVLMKPYNSNTRIEDMDLLYADIHNTILEFKSSFRPDLRYCYFRYISSILIWLNLEEAKVFKNAWIPKGKWLRESLVVEMARPERLANWEVYEEIICGNGLFDDGGEDGDMVVKMDNGWMTTKSGEMAAQLEWGLLTSPDYMFPPHGHELHV
ncbi:hypothetical protein TWF102_006025 [Orbilia oligospora]|uniref:HNH nuclease domain-containing protein n=1 Tax=Orbilia oligospora TaxID=2813651 RepID=A0A7C8J9K2_ORBOL|nr:hypothetical protein TWF102_006025 [Orbilia oligospora]KAF3115117.1 hypothetical protein TWF706_007235 [Orbilia oligospora]